MTEPFPNGKEGRPHRAESWNGIKFFKGSPLWAVDNLQERVRAITADHLRENMEVWRPEETVEAAVPFFNEGKVMVAGPPQSGKGTILFGLSEMCDQMGVGYMFFNGHHQEVPGKELAAQIERADQMGYPILFDSYDYLFLGSRSKGRAISAAAQMERDDLIVQALDRVTVPVAVTFHDPEHSAAFMSPELIARYDWFHSKFPRFEIPLYLQSRESVLRFLKDHHVPDTVASFLTDLGANADFASAVEAMQPVAMTPDELVTSVKTYPVLKELVRDEEPVFMEIMDRVFRGPADEGYQQSLADLAVLLEKTEAKRLGLTQERLRKSLRRHGRTGI